MRNQYSTLDIGKALDIPRERLRDWMNRGFVKPSTPAPGQGIGAVFTRSDVYTVALFKKLLELGMKREAAAGYVGNPMAPGIPEHASYVLIQSVIHKGERVILAQPFWAGPSIDISIEEKRIPLLGPTIPDREWDDIHIINVIKLRKDVDAALAALE